MSSRTFAVLLAFGLLLSLASPAWLLTGAGATGPEVRSVPTARAASLPSASRQADAGEIAAVLVSAKQVAAGYVHTCALTATGGVKCWGNNETWQLGDGTKTDRDRPVDVLGLASGVIAITGGNRHTCALTSAGGVKCWGDNGFGQLGDGSGHSATGPVNVSGLTSGVIAVTAGESHTCALTTAGGVKCWGIAARTGDGTSFQRPTPVDVLGLTSGVASLDAGAYHTCAIMDEAHGGGMVCWGGNQDGQLGDGTTTFRYAPVPGGLASGAKALAAGGAHTCVLTSGGAVKCWGSNYNGQVGDGTTTSPRLASVDVIGLGGGIAAVAAGAYHNCAVLITGGVRCWGSNWSAELGIDTPGGARTVPVDVLGIEGDAMGVTGGYDHSCAVTSTGAVMCWGSNSSGQLGVGTPYGSYTPVGVPGVTSGALMVATGGGYNGSHTCAVIGAPGNAAVKCWGRNYDGELGDGTKTDRYTPLPVMGMAGGGALVATGYAHSCAVSGGGGLKCWGSNANGQLGEPSAPGTTPTDVRGLTSGVASVAAGGGHTCALTTGAGVKCWGHNGRGELGDGTTDNRWTPVDVTGLTSAVSVISTGGSHTCALTTGGGVKCWGSNRAGQLGDSTTTDRHVPVDVGGLLSGAVAIAAGGDHSCALRSSGKVTCWGNNEYGQLGDGTNTSRAWALAVSGLPPDIVAVTAGYHHTCARSSNGLVWCWGQNQDGQLGDGTAANRNAPAQVTNLSGVSAISAGGSYYEGHTCVVLAEGQVMCWGRNSTGQLGVNPGWSALLVNLDPEPVSTTCLATPTPLPPLTEPVPANATVARRVASCVDDVYVRVDTGERLYDREFVRMGARDGGSVPYVTGFLFRDVRVPRGSQITSAHLRLQPELHQSGTPVLVSIAGELHGQSGDFSPGNWDPETRPRTVARVQWSLDTAPTALTDSPDISSVVAEIVGLPDWAPGNNLVILIDPAPGGQQYVNWKSYDLSPIEAAELEFSYVAPAATVTPTPDITSTATETPAATSTATASVGAGLPVYLPVIVR